MAGDTVLFAQSNSSSIKNSFWEQNGHTTSNGVQRTTTIAVQSLGLRYKYSTTPGTCQHRQDPLKPLRLRLVRTIGIVDDHGSSLRGGQASEKSSAVPVKFGL